MSGGGIVGDNAGGELIVPERLWIDTEFDLENIKDNVFTGACEAIVEASKTGKIRTMILLPGLIYGTRGYSRPLRSVLSMCVRKRNM